MHFTIDMISYHHAGYGHLRIYQEPKLISALINKPNEQRNIKPLFHRSCAVVYTHAKIRPKEKYTYLVRRSGVWRKKKETYLPHM